MDTTMGMDRKIEKKKWHPKKIAGIGAAVIVLSVIVYNFLLADRRSKLNVERDKITISLVKYDTFQEFIPRTGTVQPIETFYIDAIESGIVKSIVRESGAMVNKGDTVMMLSNSNLELTVMNRETALYEQINTTRQTRLSLQQNDLDLRRNLAEIEYNLELWGPQYKRLKELAEKKMVPYRDYEEVKEQYEYNLKRKELMYTRYRRDSIAMVTQMSQLDFQQNRMLKSLEAVGNILDNLIIRAPIAGQLTTPEIRIGESITTGQRLGQVDIIDRFKVRVRIDELYLTRIDVGQQGSFPHNGQTWQVRISKKYPTVSEGTFAVDMDFVGNQPDDLKPGQSVRIRLELGSSAQATLLPVGGFYSDTGGNWVYVLDETGEKAIKREIRIGRRNPNYFEVIEGLEAGERVITSSYEHFGDNEVLVLKK